MASHTSDEQRRNALQSGPQRPHTHTKTAPSFYDAQTRKKCRKIRNVVTGDYPRDAEAANNDDPDNIEQIIMTAKHILMPVGDSGKDDEIMAPFQALLTVGHQVHAACPDKKAGDSVMNATHDVESRQTWSRSVTA